MVEQFTTEGGKEPNTTPGGGVWMSGGGLATDNKGSMYFATGNGYASQLHGTPVPGRQPPTSLEEAAVNMKINDDGSLSVADFFMPWEKEQLDGADKDLGTTPLELLPPDVFKCANVKRMGVVTGKSGKTYMWNLDNLGGYQMGANKLDAIPQAPIQNENSVYAGAGVYPLEGGYIYINVIQYQTHVFKFSCDANGNPAFTKVADSPEKAAYVLGVGHGTTTSLNGQAGTGLYWMTDVDGFNLRIYNAVPQGGSLQLIKSANIPGVTKFSRPVFGDGRAYVGTTQGLLYAFGSPVNLPLTCTSPVDFGKVLINKTSTPITVQCQANVYTQLTSITLKNPKNFQISGLPNMPIDVPAGQNISFKAVFAPVAPGPLSVDVAIGTSNADTKYASNTPVSLKGIGSSDKPLLSVNPNLVSFNGVIVGQSQDGETSSVIFTNQGDGLLTVQGLDYSVVSETGALVTPNKTANGVQVGPFTFSNIPTTIAGNSDAIVNINFNPKATGNYAVYIHVRTDGGTKIFDVVGTASSSPKALLEFQAADGSGRWIPYTNNSPPFTFGSVYEQQTKVLKMRLTNNGSASAGSLSVTVSKPPFGVPGIVGAQNGADLGEGTTLAAGESATANLFCSVPMSQVNIDSYNGSATWVMNTGDPNFGKQFIQFTCTAIAEQVGPLYANGSAVYRYNGCYKENNPGRQLKTQLWGQDPATTNNKCLNACAAAGWAIAATEYETECWCGNNFPIALANETDCNYRCAGNQSQTCGGNGYFHDGSFMSLFTNGKGKPPTISAGGPVVVKSVGPYNYTGCFMEPAGARALGSDKTASDEMTLETCASYCSAYTYFGIEYASECYCGNTLASGAAKTTEDQCSMTCGGNQTQICGAGNRLTTYKRINNDPVPPPSGTSTTSSTATATSGPIAVPKAGKFTYQGCYTEGTNTRALADVNTATNSMTVEQCASFCSAYTYMAVEYSSECYCGNTIGAGAVLATDNGCTMTCSGNSSEYCGGPNRLNFYKGTQASTTSGTSTTTSSTSTTSTTSTGTSTTTTPTGPTAVPLAGSYAYQGCYSEGTNGRALGAKYTVSGTMTVEQCATFCNGYTYMGVEYSSECYCDNTIAAGSVLVTDGGCSMTCGGNQKELCGGPNRLNFYKKSGSSSSSTTSTSSTSAASTTGPVIVPSSGTFSYKGCYSEGTNGRALSDKNTAAQSMTVEVCATFCKGYAYMGVEYSTECFCGNTINAGSALATSGCTMTCGGNPRQLCGGPNRLNFYAAGAASSSKTSTTTSQTSTTSKTTSTSTSTSTSTTSTAVSTGPVTVSNLAGYKYLGCYNEVAGGRALSDLQNPIPASTVSVESCSKACAQYNYFGVEYSGECYCGNKINTGSALVSGNDPSTTQCNMRCNGNSTEYCGGPNRLNMYQKTSSASATTSSTTTSPTTSPSAYPGNVNYAYTACYTDSTASRTLSDLVLADNAMTIDKCLTACNAYTYAAVEYGQECWCGNTIAATGKKAPQESDCNFQCPGNPSQFCGAGDRMSLYTRKASAPKAKFAAAQAAATSTAAKTSTTQTRSSTTKSSTATSSTTTSSTSKTSSTTVQPTASQTLNSYTYLGCANQTSPYALAGFSTQSTTTTTSSCQKFCASKNYGLAGTTNGNTCFCGNGLQSFSSLKQPSTKCNEPCAGNTTEICGGQGYLSVWNATSAINIPPTTAKQVGYYPLKGCYNSTTPSTTKSGKPQSLLSGSGFTAGPLSPLDVEACVSYCSIKDFAVAGLEAGNKCICGMAKDVANVQDEALGGCNTLCTGNKREFCGGKEKTLVYAFDQGSVDGNGKPKSMGQSNEAVIKPAA
ncbi:MAG: hypothetical protein Q9214_002599 [Letrouitia sp. 1 TL-2023]